MIGMRAVFHRIESRIKSGRTGGRRGVKARQFHAFRGEPVDVRRLGIGTAPASDVVKRKIVRDENDEVWF